LFDEDVAAEDDHGTGPCSPEHGDWAQRTLELESVGQHPASGTYHWAARGATVAGDYAAAIAWAERGIQAAPWPDHADAAECWGALIVGHLGLGRAGAAVEPAQHLAMIEATLPDSFDQWEAVRSLLENAQANDRGSVPRLVDRLTELAGQISAPSLLSQASY
jgi:hypothetical protein